MASELVLYERKNHTGILTVNRPAALNALNGALLAELERILTELSGADIRCLIVTGAGDKAFVAGADIGEMKDLTPEAGEAWSDAGNRVMEGLERLPMPVIAAVNGYALGGGCELALSCDIRVAAETAVFGMPETALGVIPGFGGVQRLARTVGLSKAKELVFTGDRVNAQAALAMGLVDHVAPPQKLMETALALAEKIGRSAPLAVRGAKKVADASVGRTLEEAARLEREPFGACFGTKDQRMAMEAFVNKEKPGPFTGE